VVNNALAHSGNIKIAAKTAPPVSPYHVVREGETKLMIHHLVEASSIGRKIFVITGVEGCGKTQTVSYFLHINSNASL
jgi:DNA transposition AAA+ family ATPase